MDREEKQRLIRRLTQAFNRIDGAYYYCARRLGVEENTLAELRQIARELGIEGV